MKTTRRIVQILFLVLFLILILKTTYPLNFKHTHLFLSMSSLLALTQMLSVRSYVHSFELAIIIAIGTIFLGRFFCGWVCPFGTTLDITDRLFKKKKNIEKKTQKKLISIKYILLIFLLVLATLGIQIAGWFDPICISVRSYGLVVYTYFNFLAEKTFLILGRLSIVGGVADKFYNFAKENFLAYTQPVFSGSILIFLFFIGILFLGIFLRRFWCRNLCPLGALFGFLSLKPLVLKRYVSDTCDSCSLCESKCKMGAITEEGKTEITGECILCFDCVQKCPKGAIDYKFTNHNYKLPKFDTVDISKRSFVFSLGAGLISVPFFEVNFLKNKVNNIIHPPGSVSYEQFFAKCVRCGECMKVCPTNYIHPALFEKGVAGMWTPNLNARLGYCEYNCALCGEVCPSGAIQKLSIEEKKKTVIGIAYFCKSRCITWIGYDNCTVCEEMCPVPEKAIVLRKEHIIDPAGKKRILLRPYVIEELCIGCGICETKCPVEGASAIKIIGLKYQKKIA